MKFLLTTAKPYYHRHKDAKDLKALYEIGYPMESIEHDVFRAKEFEKDINTMQEFAELLLAMDSDVIVGRPRLGSIAEIRRYDYWVE